MGVAIQMPVPVEVPEEQKIDRTLIPVGYRVLVRILPETEQEAQRLIQLPPEQREREWGAKTWAEVITLGPDAYKDEKRFPGGPWCKAGDTILMKPYSGTRFKVEHEYRDEDGNIRVEQYLYALINDDTVLGLTEEPQKVERA